ncbi:MAG TPA: efflux RND transporter periplasmic adaptor subunit [Candidatus Hydrogenedentes bacterium]|mgnify:CR=1 FL=1|nr:efflux RND transporter periplasmic adaptor subunit [Candidatus Hydrogenedentota bacterium]
MKKIHVTLLTSSLIVAFGGVVAVISANVRSRTLATEKASIKVEQQVPNVKVRVLHAEALDDQITLTGAIEAWKDIRLSAEIPGKVEYQGVETGAKVTAGQELFRIDTNALQAQADQALAQVTLANREYDRIQSLSGRGATPLRDLDNAVAGRDVAAAALRSARIALGKSVLKAPMDGIVDTVFRKQDEFVDMGAPLVRLVQVERVKLTIGIPERDIPHFSEGNRVSIRIDALPDRTFDGSIHSIAPAADAMTHTFLTEIVIENASGEIRPGMIARATLVRRTYPDAIAIPIFSSVNLQNLRVVFLEHEGKASIRPIETGIVAGSLIQVTSGLAPGDRLIVAGQRDVREGEPVHVTEVLE